jgi:NAD(P)-dependent dehydrogenase (short-subunit alcohol dehydrogenase family)
LDVTQLPEHLDGFVYAPGSINLRPFSGLKPETFAQDMEVNFLAMVRVLQSVLPKLKKSEAASIVLFSTVAVSVGMPFHTSVAAAKGAVEGFARSLAAELAPKIRVNVVAPSLTDTPLANKFLNNEQKMENAALRHPLKSVGTADQIAQTAAFLLSDKASWTTGQVLGVDGGMSRLNLG